jgi:hypothetical protein
VGIASFSGKTVGACPSFCVIANLSFTFRFSSYPLHILASPKLPQGGVGEVDCRLWRQDGRGKNGRRCCAVIPLGGLPHFGYAYVRNDTVAKGVLLASPCGGSWHDLQSRD